MLAPNEYSGIGTLPMDHFDIYMFTRMKPYIPLLTIAVLLGAGCVGSDSTGSNAADVASEPGVAERVFELNFEAVSEAFQNLRGLSHSVTRTTTLASAEGERRYRRIEHLTSTAAEEEQYQSLSTTEQGEVPSGFFSRLYTPQRHTTMETLSSLLLEDEPPFAMARNEAVFTYAALPDTTLHGVAANVILIRRSPDEDRGKPYESVRLYIDPRSAQVMALHASLKEETLFLSRHSTHWIELMPTNGGRLVPALARIETETDMLFSPRQRMSSSWRFEPGA